MVLYNENVELDLEKFDIYNLYRDQICYLKVNKNQLNLNIDPDNWKELKTIVNIEDANIRIKTLRKWFSDVSSGLFGNDKDFDFTDSLLNLILEHLKAKFN